MEDALPHLVIGLGSMEGVGPVHDLIKGDFVARWMVCRDAFGCQGMHGRRYKIILIPGLALAVVVVPPSWLAGTLGFG